jgi:hypothetical protein
MSWFLRIDRFGSGHLVKSQEQDFSCLMASMAMVNFKIKKGYMFAGLAASAAVSVVPIAGAQIAQSLSRDAIDYAVKSEAEVRALYERVSGAPHDFNTTGAGNFDVQMLNDLGLGRWEAVNVGAAGFAQAAIDATAKGAPVFGFIDWDGGNSHAVVIDETHGFFGTTYLCVCDPWDGELRLIKANSGGATRYDGNYKPISLTFGGDRRQYPAGNQGQFSGWITRRL